MDFYCYCYPISPMDNQSISDSDSAHDTQQFNVLCWLVNRALPQFTRALVCTNNQQEISVSKMFLSQKSLRRMPSEHQN